jgi:hypothetical protein
MASNIDTLRQVVEHLDIDGGLVASLEHPGCVVVPARDSKSSYWWGTANETWGADLLDADGNLVGTLTTSLSSDCDDPSMIALIIGKAMLSPATKQGR